MNLNNKKIFIAPYTQRTIMFKEELSDKYNFTFLGFIDKEQAGNEIKKIEEICQL